MTFEEAKVLAKQGIKMTHENFASNESMTMKGNKIIFEDGVSIFENEWFKGKEYLTDGWSIFK